MPMATPETPGPGRTPVTPDLDEAAPGPVPPENRPGHHPEVEQDKPRRRPRSAPRRATPDRAAGDERFEFAFEPRLRPFARLFGVSPGNAYVDVGDDQLTVHFGRWSLRTPLANVAAATATGPYNWWKVAGPAHLSVADGGITFATTTAGGLCIAFHEPVPAMLPTPALRHGAATVTVADPDALAAALRAAAPAMTT